MLFIKSIYLFSVQSQGGGGGGGGGGVLEVYMTGRV